MAAWLKEFNTNTDMSTEPSYPWRSSFTSKNPDLYFRDGKRRIDFVLVYSKTDSKWNEIRQSFLRSLALYGVEIEVEDCFGRLLGATCTTRPDQQIKAQKVPSVTAAAPPISEPVEALRKGLAKHDTTQGPPSSMDRYRIAALESEELFTSDDLVFVKLYAPWKTMGRYAELFQFRKPLIVSEDAELDEYNHRPCCEGCQCCGRRPSKFPPLRAGYTWPFSTQREYLFDIPPNRDEFFTEVERALVLDYILRRAHCFLEDDWDDTCLSDEERPKYEHHVTDSPESNVDAEKNLEAKLRGLNIGITKLVSDGVFLTAYPLHEPSNKKEMVSDVNNRIMLRRYWASYHSVARQQPLDYIRYYFGEAIGFYFAWLGFYTTWLIPVAVLGLLTFLLGLLGIPSDGIIKFVCGTGANTTMCPLCSRPHCEYWNLGASCFRQKLTHLVDNEGTILFSVIMALWAILFLEMWKRRQISLAFRWNVYALEPVDQPARPEFLALLLKGYDAKINPISGNLEPMVPFWRKRVPRTIFTYSAILFLVMLTLACLIGVILYKLAIKIVLYQQPNLIIQTTAGMITTITGSVINLIFIFIMKMIYDRLAVKMTDWELHRTQMEYDNSLTLKLYMLQFVNYYSSVFYIAFIQGTTSALPGSDTLVVQSVGCDQGDCLFELFLQLMVIMVGKQLFNFCQEALMPVILRLFNRMKAKRKQNKRATEVFSMQNPEVERDEEAMKRLLACRADYNLLDPGSRPLFNEYLEMMIQYGFITMFVPAFPLAPFFGLLNNMFELRGDAKKFVCQYRRPVVDRVKTIGIWFSILLVLSSLAIRTNACIIAFTTKFIDRMVYRHHYKSQFSDFNNFTLSVMETSRFPINTTEKYCFYEDYRQPPWIDPTLSRTLVYYHVLAVKFIFVFMFETIAICFTSFIAAIIPDTPKHIATQIHREANITNQIILHTEKKRQKEGTSEGFEPDSLPGPHGMQDRVLRDALNRLNVPELNQELSTVLPMIGFYMFDEEPQPVIDHSQLPPSDGRTEPDEHMPLIGFSVPQQH